MRTNTNFKMIHTAGLQPTPRSKAIVILERRLDWECQEVIIGQKR